ncbi:MAG: 50S ribosomal protein L35 [Candidatus Levybacteria bacterium]|nr:50S ribosomal protein L35 [Candidatus Levybacteria bacterium]
MYKLKTKRSVKRRFKVTKTGKVLRGSQMRSHLRSHKSKGTLRAQKEIKLVHGKFAKKIKQLLGEA